VSLDPPRRVVVTGASGGIGRAIARRFCDDGATVVNLDRADPAAAAALCGPLLKTVAVDLADPDAVARAFEDVDAIFGGEPPGVLVCCAAMSVATPLLAVPVAEFDRQFAVNVRGTFVSAQAAARRMKRVRRGQIVVITSVAAEQAWAGEPVYCMTKAAQRALVQALAVELAPFGIRANAVGPGIVDHPSQHMGRTRDEGGVLQHDLDRTPLGRFAAPEEIAEAVAFAASAPWMTGQTIYVDGGFLASGLAWFGSRREKLE
jgi:NAD(P)-dependent dehydrogenase (short-subunit alcohol dehydrogenase family)